MSLPQQDPTYSSWAWNDRVPFLECISNDPLALAVHNPQQVQELLRSGVSPSATALYAAITTYSVDSFELMLEAGADPNVRLLTLPELEQSASTDRAHKAWTGMFWTDRRLWYPLQHVMYPRLFRCRAPDQDGKLRIEAMTSRMIALLMKHGANLCAIFAQPVKRRPNFLYPGVANPEDDVFDEEDGIDGDEMIFEGQWNIMRHAELPAMEQYPSGLRSLAHAALEDGVAILPLLLEYNMDIEMRDPLGRTLFLSACRSVLGADALVKDMASTTPLSLFDTFRQLGADIMTSDCKGLHALHHLLLAYHDDSDVPPPATSSIHWILEHAPTLINKPDHAGTYPLHSSLQLLRRYRMPMSTTMEARPMQRVHLLVNAGANPLSTDEMGNNGLHYALDNLMGVQFGQGQQVVLANRFLVAGVDLHARNKLGQSPLDILLHMEPQAEDVRGKDADLAVLSLVHKAGARWADLNPATGDTCFHAVVRHDCLFQLPRMAYLLDCGLDPQLRNAQGETVVDVARQQDDCVKGFFKSRGLFTWTGSRECVMTVSIELVSKYDPGSRIYDFVAAAARRWPRDEYLVAYSTGRGETEDGKQSVIMLRSLSCLAPKSTSQQVGYFIADIVAVPTCQNDCNRDLCIYAPWRSFVPSCTLPTFLAKRQSIIENNSQKKNTQTPVIEPVNANAPLL